MSKLKELLLSIAREPRDLKYGTIFSIEDFFEMVNEGYVASDDGSGHYVIEGKIFDGLDLYDIMEVDRLVLNVPANSKVSLEESREVVDGVEVIHRTMTSISDSVTLLITPEQLAELGVKVVWFNR